MRKTMVIALGFVSTAVGLAFGATYDDLCRGRVLGTIQCTRTDTIFVEVLVDTVYVELPGDQGFLEPPADGWIDGTFFGYRPGNYAVTLRDSLGNERQWMTIESSPIGSLVFPVPPEPWAFKFERVEEPTP